MRKLSASAITTFRSCPYSFYYRYIQNLKRIDIEENENFKLGKAFHSILENANTISKDYDIDKKTFLSIVASADYIYENYKLEAVGELTLKQIFESVKVLKEYTINIDGYIGFIDLVIPLKTGDILIDYKYVGSFEYADSYAISDQSKIYPTLYTKQTGRTVAKIVYLCVNKPTIRLKKTETDTAYLERVKEWYTAGDKVKEIIIEGEQLEELKKEFEVDMHYIKHMIENDIYYKNPSNCLKYGSQCDFFPICSNEENYEVLYKGGVSK